MKKLIASLTLVCVLTFAVFAFAATPSKTVDDMYSAVVVNEDGSKAEGAAIVYIIPDNEAADAQLSVLTEKGADEYFGAALAEAEAIAGEDSEICEFLGIGVNGFDGAMGGLKVRFTFATPFEKGEKGALLIGTPAGEGYSWQVFEAEGLEDGSAEAVLTEEILNAVQEQGGLICLVK